MNLKQTVIIGVFVLMAVSAFPQGQFTMVKDVNGFRQKFAEASRSTLSIEASFRQEKNLSVLSEKIITKGLFLFKKENKLRWEYTDPFHYLIILNKGTIYTLDEDKKSKIDLRSNKMFTEINAIMMGCVQGNLFNDEKKFSSQFLENSNQYLVRMKPLDTNLKSYLSGIWIYLDKKDMTVTRLEMHEPSGDNTMVDFLQKKLNIPLADDKFLLH
jgi:outer membrane lipoprotein-sorting protein